jgi:hypothetical protein
MLLGQALALGQRRMLMLPMPAVQVDLLRA